MYVLESLRIALPDNGNTDEGWQWADVQIYLKNATTDERPSVSVGVHIRSDESQSIAAAKQQARDRALRVLREAVRVLEGPV
ncbi:MAG: hypothetical protein Q7T19_06435 [Caulobacter sp.]|nr:hypothetical protein [Caulobacter sp.]